MPIGFMVAALLHHQEGLHDLDPVDLFQLHEDDNLSEVSSETVTLLKVIIIIFFLLHCPSSLQTPTPTKQVEVPVTVHIFNVFMLTMVRASLFYIISFKDSLHFYFLLCVYTVLLKLF